MDFGYFYSVDNQGDRYSVLTGVICVDTVNQLLFVFRKNSQCLHLFCHEPASYCLQNRICLIILTDCHKIYSPELPGSFSLVNYEIKPWVKVVYTTVWVVLDSTCVYIQYNFINENSTFYWKLGNICLQLNGIFFFRFVLLLSTEVYIYYF